MARGGALRSRAPLGLVLLLAGPVTGCGPSDTAQDTAAPPATSSPASAPEPRTTSPEDLCVRVVADWARRSLESGTYGDYQSMGLSNRQYEILREVLDAARAERKRRGARAVDESIGREARQRCADRYRAGAPSKGPWQ
ncbi:hypothetical protein [Streptomyces bullii]|uniref:Lipoprotein n=1 Tax=Streptomyces bullii TaxID=349910 RepID=A0ABW0UTF0_9ACTN